MVVTTFMVPTLPIWLCSADVITESNLNGNNEYGDMSIIPIKAAHEIVVFVTKLHRIFHYEHFFSFYYVWLSFAFFMGTFRQTVK